MAVAENPQPRHMGGMRATLCLAALLAAAPATGASESLFSRLVDASSRADHGALIRLLSTQPLSSSTGEVGEDGRLSEGPMRHGVSALEIAGKLQGCAAAQWRDFGSEQGQAYILWRCPTRRVPRTNCYFYSYRAEMLDPRYHSLALYVGEMPSWDPRCGMRPALPPRP